MASQKINVVQNDNNIKLIFTIKKDGIEESILGATIRFQMYEQSKDITLKRNCTITDPTTAECMYILTSDDLIDTGTYQTELQIIYPNGTKLTQRNPVIINVLPEVVLN
jgi:hypothetical protein